MVLYKKSNTKEDKIEMQELHIFVNFILEVCLVNYKWNVVLATKFYH